MTPASSSASISAPPTARWRGWTRPPEERVAHPPAGHPAAAQPGRARAGAAAAVVSLHSGRDRLSGRQPGAALGSRAGAGRRRRRAPPRRGEPVAAGGQREVVAVARRRRPQGADPAVGRAGRDPAPLAGRRLGSLPAAPGGRLRPGGRRPASARSRCRSRTCC